MIWLKNFLLGLFTGHIGMKALALLLSVGLFSFVQLAQTGTAAIPSLNLDLRLDEELRETRVLLTPRIPITKISITGLRAQVDPEAKRYLGDPEKVLTLTASFLARHGRNGDVIPITADFFKDEALFGKDILVTGLPEGLAIRLDTLVRKENISVLPDPNTTLTLPEKHENQGTLPGGLLDLRLNVNQVTLTGPASAFLESSQLFVSFPTLAEELQVQVFGEVREVTVKNAVIDWQTSGVEPTLVDKITIASSLSAEPLSAREFEAALRATCDVIPKKEPVSRTLPILILNKIDPEYRLIEEYATGGGLKINVEAIESGRVEDFKLTMPKVLVGDEDFAANLVLVLNVADAFAEDAARIEVPVYLGLKDYTRADHVEALRQVEIDATPPWKVAFTKKQ